MFFLPQLMASAGAVKTSFDLIRDHAGRRKRSRNHQRRGRPLLLWPRCRGDIHDISKNIVKMLLENYGFTVIDLGRDVAPEAVWPPLSTPARASSGSRRS